MPITPETQYLFMRYHSRQTALILSMVAALVASAQTDRPVISAVANAASYSQGPIAQGEMVVLFGSGLGPSQLVNLQLDAQGKVATTLSDVQVFFDGNPAPLVYVSGTQIAALVPYGLDGKSTTAIQVVYRGVMSDPTSKAVAATAPAIFSADTSGKGQGSINNLDGSRNSVTNPVTPGSYITFYITGYGQTDPPGSDGAVSTGLASVKAQVSVTVAGRTAQVLYAGSAPGFVSGFAQVNVQVPADLSYGGNLPLVILVGDASSQPEITVAVAGLSAPLPSAPIGVTTTTIPPNQIRVGWNTSDNLASRFHIEKQTGGSGQFVEVATVTGMTFTDSSVVLGDARLSVESSDSDLPYSTPLCVFLQRWPWAA